MIGIEGIVTRNPVTLRESDTLGDALELMASQKIHHVPVVDDEHHVIGLVSHRDVLAAAHAPGFVDIIPTYRKGDGRR